MNALIEAFVNRPRPVLLILAMLIIAGITSYVTIPKESQPGPREGQKVFTLQTLPASPKEPRPDVAESSGFSLHAGDRQH